jgi:hypothetical protein
MVADLAPAPAPLGGIVRGRVIYGGAGQVGVKVRIGTAGRTRSTLTEADGRFSFADVPAGAYALHADQPEQALGAAVPVDVGLEPEAPVDPDAGTPVVPVTDVIVELLPTVRMVGLVRDDLGKPLPGAFVRIEEEERPLPAEVETGADGRFGVEGRLRGRSYRVTVRRAGYLPEGPRSVKAGGLPIDVKLKKGAILTGTVVDEHGAAVSGAELGVVEQDGAAWAPMVTVSGGGADSDGWRRLEPAGELGVLRGPIPYPPLQAPTVTVSPSQPAPSSTLRSDTKGAFRIAELQGGSVIVTARHPDFAAAASVPVQLIAGGTRNVQIVLKKGTSLRGRVVDDRANGIADAEVVSSDGRTAITDSAGRFGFEHLVSSVKLSARRQGYLKGEGSVEIDGQRELTTELKLARALGRLGGQVVDARGNPVAGARVLIAPRGADSVRVMADAGGRFLVEGLPDGPYRVEVERAGGPTLRLSAIEATTEARLVMETGGGVEGEVFDTRTGSPPADARLEIVLDGERRAVALSGRRFRVVGLPTGPAKLVVHARGYPRTERSIEVIGAERPGEVTVLDVRIELELGGQVKGRVRDDRGANVSGAEVEVLGSAVVEPVRSGSDGTFVLSGVPEGRAKLRARMPDGRAVDDEVEVRPNEESRVDLTLPAPR